MKEALKFVILYSGGLERRCRSRYIPLSRVSHEDSILKAFASRVSCSSQVSRGWSAGWIEGRPAHGLSIPIELMVGR